MKQVEIETRPTPNISGCDEHDTFSHYKVYRLKHPKYFKHNTKWKTYKIQ